MREECAEIAERPRTEVTEAGLAGERAVRTDVLHEAILEYATERGSPRS